MLREWISNQGTISFLIEKHSTILCVVITDLSLILFSQFKYKEAYEHIKANGYTLGPKDVPFVHVRRVNNVTSEVSWTLILWENTEFKIMSLFEMH